MDRVRLNLLLNDASSAFEQVEAKMDCWFLDGFAPSKNPDMWSESLFRAIASLSHSQTTLSTFTCAGLVKRGLIQQGIHYR